MRCPGCGETNDEGYRFCRNCGRALPPSESPLIPASVGTIPASAETAPDEAPAPAEASPSYRLVATAGLLSGRTFTIGTAGLTIGRDPTCQVVVADDEISRLHAWVGMNDERQVVVRDRHSANGTYVNRVRVQEKVLRTADEISFGSARRQRFRIEQVDDPAAQPYPDTGTSGGAR